jgi:glycosyltransferase involved in cell wall biosynthesis
LDFLVAAAREIRRRIPNFQLLIVGDGPERDRLAVETRQDQWIHWLGPRHSEEKVLLLSLADVMLNPGAVGLSILDSFACRVPVFTTDCDLHGPEIAYLQHEKNGIVTADELTTFVDAVSSTLFDARKLETLRIGCAESASRYTIGNMAMRFYEGIEACLKVPTLRT